jgi:tetratricopeptide (TPR) repeat protein
LKSILPLEPQQILLGTYSPIKIDSKIAAVIELNKDNYNEGLNQLQEIAQTDWILYLKDNEAIIQFNEYIPNLFVSDKEVYGFHVLQDDVILKEPRLWNKKINKVIFKNPVFEKPNIEPTKMLDVILYQHKTEDPTALRKLETWKRTMPLSIDAAYYKAFASLAERNFTEFKRIIAHYLFNLARSDIPSVMARYYLALVQGVVENNTKEAIKNVVICLAENPLMAEFWCLLGDIFVKAEKFEEAVEFYENGIMLGSRRLNSDLWPMHISKYDAYPKEMIEKCKKAINSAETYRSNV